MVEPIRLVLCMIVRNEAAVIQRCLESVLPHVDGFVVCDTGSTDDTIRIVEQTAGRHGVPGLVVQHAWRNFGVNRTSSANEARAWVEAQGWSVRATYLLHLDADMVLHVHPGFDRQLLSATAFDVPQDNGALRYWNTRLTRLSHQWVAVGATHEYWRATPGGAVAARLDSMHIEDLGDGGSRIGKSERDVELLRSELEHDPKDPRHTFYLAQTYYDLGRWQEAAEWYARRRRLGGWAEELWYACYREGLSLLSLGEANRGTSTLLEAFEERPTRAEPLWALARHFREAGKNQLALLFARRGLELPYPDRDALFLESPVYDWQLWEEVMISAFYAGADHHDLGFSACERLLARRGHDESFYSYVARNETFYLAPFTASRHGAFELPRAVREHDGVTFEATNPSIARWRDQIYVNVRMVNYRTEAGLDYSSMSPDGVFRTYNATLRWDPEGSHDEPIALTADIPIEWPSDTPVRGLEDVRWTVYQDRIWFTATCYQVPGAAGTCRVVLGRLNTQLDSVEHLVPLQFEHARAVEKNWLPWPMGDELRLIYSYDPFTVLRVDPASGDTLTVHETKPQFRAADLRGSCPPVPHPDGSGRSIALVHEVAARSSGRVYSHRWIEIDNEVGIVSYSRPFVFGHVGIEYATGLCDLDGEHLIVTYGFEDREARWAEYRWDAVIASLRAREGLPQLPFTDGGDPRSRSSEGGVQARDGSSPVPALGSMPPA